MNLTLCPARAGERGVPWVAGSSESCAFFRASFGVRRLDQGLGLLGAGSDGLRRAMVGLYDYGYARAVPCACLLVLRCCSWMNLAFVLTR